MFIQRDDATPNYKQTEYALLKFRLLEFRIRNIKTSSVASLSLYSYAAPKETCNDGVPLKNA
jgi:hypothetical protein